MLIYYQEYICIGKILWIVAIFFYKYFENCKKLLIKNYKKKLFGMIILITYIKIMIVFYNILNNGWLS